MAALLYFKPGANILGLGLSLPVFRRSWQDMNKNFHIQRILSAICKTAIQQNAYFVHSVNFSLGIDRESMYNIFGLIPHNTLQEGKI